MQAFCRYLFFSVLAGTLFITAACGRARALAEEGLLRLDQGKQTTALELFDRALSYNAQEPYALYGKGMLLSEEHITEEIALTMLRQAAGQDTLKEAYRLRALVRIAEIAAKRGDKDEALQNLSKTSGTGRNIDGATLRRVASIYLLLKEKERAREVVTAFLETHAGDTETEYFLLRLYVLSLRDLKSAGRVCLKANWQKSQNSRYLLNCSRVLAAVNDYTNALDLVNLYLKSTEQEDKKDAHDLRDNIQRKRGRFEPGESDF